MRYDWTVEIAGEDWSSWVKAGGTIDYGVKSLATSFQAPVAVFEMFTKDENPNPAPPYWPDILLGDTVIIHATRDGFTQSRRFTGIVQALDWGLTGLRVTATGSDVDQGGPQRGTGYYGSAVDWAATNVGATGNVQDIPDQTDVDRVKVLVGDSQFNIEVEGVPARRTRAIPKNTPGQPLLDALLRIADDADGLLMSDRLGVMRYRTKNFVRPARWTIPAHLVESTSIDLALERGTVINAVTVYYGEPDATTGNQRSVFDQDTQSIIEVGERRADIYTDIQYEAGARGRAQDYLNRNRQAWQMPDVALVMSNATGDDADAVWELQERWRVKVTPLPDGCPIPEYDGDILGFTEVMHETDYRIILHLAPPLGDEDVPPEAPIFDDHSITGGVESTYEDQYGFLWRLHAWETPGPFPFTINNPVTPWCLVIAGGGGGSWGPGMGRAGAPGGAGGLFHRELAYTPGSGVLTVGAGGPVAENGQDSTLTNVIVKGGGRGGGQLSGAVITPGDGGSGGGATNEQLLNWGKALGGSLDGGQTWIKGYPFYGHDGAVDVGGGAAGQPTGLTLDITGIGVEYARGGETLSGLSTPGSGGSGDDPLGPDDPSAGRDGAVYIAYRIG